MVADFRIWGRIEHVAPQRFFVIVSSVREDDPADAHHVHHIAPSRIAAEEARCKLMIEVGAEIAAQGDRVIDVEADG